MSNIFFGYAVIGCLPVFWANHVLGNAELGLVFLGVQVVSVILGALTRD